MRVWRQFVIAGLLAAAVCAADAQTRVVTVPASTATGGAARILSAPSARVESTLTGGYPVSGLGFDYVHHAAVNRDLATRAVIDPATQHQLALARQLRRETPVAPVVPIFPIVNNTIVIVQQPPVIVQAPPPTIIIQQVPGAAPAAGNPPGEAAPATEPLPPPRELGEIVLVRIDGGLLFAVGYAQRGDRLVYITPEGQRRSVKIAEIDVEFTLRLNEERGTYLQLS